MKRTGYIILQVVVYLILLGGIGDIVYTFSVDPIMQAHLEYLHLSPAEVSPELRNLDLAFMRCIGSFLIAVGVGSLILLYGPIRQGDSRALACLLAIITIGEGGNALQMYFVDSPFTALPTIYVLLCWIGALLWWNAQKKTGTPQ